MRDDRQVIINPQRDKKVEDGWAWVFAAIFWGVIVVAAVDRSFTSLWKWLCSAL